MSVSLERFAGELTENGLFSAAELVAFQESLPPEKRPNDGESLARELVRAKRLTKYQAQVICQGRGKGLVFDEYVVLDKLGQGGMGLVFKAQHRRMERIVAMKMLTGAGMKTPQAVQPSRNRRRSACSSVLADWD
jgi:eukaryotic-like serine/threonine-protein kinase